MKWGVLIVLVVLAGSAPASQFGCKCLLCLADPLGPTARPPCVPPIHKLWHMLEKGKPFPTCTFADGNDGNSWAQQTRNWYDICPAGSQPAPANSHVALGVFNPVIRQYTPSGQTKVSEPDQDGGSFISASGQGSQACVGNLVGTYYDYDEGHAVNLYDSVTWQPPVNNPRAIDVYVDRALFRRVRY